MIRHNKNQLSETTKAFIRKLTRKISGRPCTTCGPSNIYEQVKGKGSKSPPKQTKTDVLHNFVGALQNSNEPIAKQIMASIEKNGLRSVRFGDINTGELIEQYLIEQTSGGSDTGSDAGSDTGSDAGSDTGSDAGSDPPDPCPDGNADPDCNPDGCGDPPGSAPCDGDLGPCGDDIPCYWDQDGWNGPGFYTNAGYWLDPESGIFWTRDAQGNWWYYVCTYVGGVHVCRQIPEGVHPDDWPPSGTDDGTDGTDGGGLQPVKGPDNNPGLKWGPCTITVDPNTGKITVFCGWGYMF